MDARSRKLTDHAAGTIRLCVAALLFLLGVVALDATPQQDFFHSLEDTGFQWLLLVPPALILLAAYGLWRRFVIARFAMYGLLTLNLAGAALMVYVSHWDWRWLLPLLLTVAASAYVQWDSKSRPRARLTGTRRLREGGFAAIYVLAVILSLVGAEVVHGPRTRTLSSPISVARP
jgi:hypothetical protein